jgi:hypothetical protein
MEEKLSMRDQSVLGDFSLTGQNTLVIDMHKHDQGENV